MNVEPIPGMIKLVPGVPFVYHLNGDPGRPVAVACLQTQQSLSAYPEVAGHVQKLADKLFGPTFGEVQNGVAVSELACGMPAEIARSLLKGQKAPNEQSCKLIVRLRLYHLTASQMLTRAFRIRVRRIPTFL